VSSDVEEKLKKNSETARGSYKRLSLGATLPVPQTFRQSGRKRGDGASDLLPPYPTGIKRRAGWHGRRRQIGGDRRQVLRLGPWGRAKLTNAGEPESRGDEKLVLVVGGGKREKRALTQMICQTKTGNNIEGKTADTMGLERRILQRQSRNRVIVSRRGAGCL